MPRLIQQVADFIEQNKNPKIQWDSSTGTYGAGSAGWDKFKKSVEDKIGSLDSLPDGNLMDALNYYMNGAVPGLLYPRAWAHDMRAKFGGDYDTNDWRKAKLQNRFKAWGITPELENIGPGRKDLYVSPDQIIRALSQNMDQFTGGAGRSW